MPLDMDDGEPVVIEQQNVGAGVEMGGGEFPDPHTPPQPPAPGSVATGPATLVDAITELEGDGFTGQFLPSDSGHLLCLNCDTRVATDAVTVHRLRRLEGASDPADMAAVAAFECPRCSARGTVALKYGPDATPDEADILRLLEKETHPAS